MVNDFKRNAFDGEKHIKSRILPTLEKEFAVKGKVIYLRDSHCSLYIQKNVHIDAIADNGEKSVGIEIKTVNSTEKYYTRLFAETRSCTLPGRESNGWMHINTKGESGGSEADLLAYVFLRRNRSLEMYVYDLPQFKQWFWQCVPTCKWQLWTMPDQNMTEGYLVPLLEIQNAGIPTHRYLILSNSYKIVPLDMNLEQIVMKLPVQHHIRTVITNPDLWHIQPLSENKENIA